MKRFVLLQTVFLSIILFFVPISAADSAPLTGYTQVFLVSNSGSVVYGQHYSITSSSGAAEYPSAPSFSRCGLIISPDSGSFSKEFQTCTITIQARVIFYNYPSSPTYHAITGGYVNVRDDGVLRSPVTPTITSSGEYYAITFNSFPVYPNTTFSLQLNCESGSSSGVQVTIQYKLLNIAYNQTPEQVEQNLQVYANQKLDDIDDKLDDIITPDSGVQDQIDSNKNKVDDNDQKLDSLADGLDVEKPDLDIADNPMLDDIDNSGITGVISSMCDNEYVLPILGLVASLMIISLLLFGV